MLKTKSAMFGIAAAVVVAGLTFASMAVTTTSGAGTDDTDATPTVVAAPTTAPSTPPQAPIEPPVIDPSGGQAGAGSGPGSLPSAGYGSADSGSQNTMLLFGLAGMVLAAGTALMFAAGKAPGNRE